jgi:hypothetical protein
MSAYIDGVLVHMEAPEGYHVDFENPLRRRVPDIYYLSGVACLLSLLSMLQRFYTKAVLDKKIQADDCEHAPAITTITSEGSRLTNHQLRD